MEIEAVRQNDNFSAAVEVPIALDRAVSSGSSGSGSTDSGESPGRRASFGSRRDSNSSQSGSQRIRKNSKPDLKVSFRHNLFKKYHLS